MCEVWHSLSSCIVCWHCSLCVRSWPDGTESLPPFRPQLLSAASQITEFLRSTARVAHTRTRLTQKQRRDALVWPFPLQLPQDCFICVQRKVCRLKHQLITQCSQSLLGEAALVTCKTVLCTCAPYHPALWLTLRYFLEAMKAIIGGLAETKMVGACSQYWNMPASFSLSYILCITLLHWAVDKIQRRNRSSAIEIKTAPLMWLLEPKVLSRFSNLKEPCMLPSRRETWGSGSKYIKQQHVTAQPKKQELVSAP